MDCPKSIKLKPASLTKQKCADNMEYWLAKYPDYVNNDDFKLNLHLSKNVLPCHTFPYDSLRLIFGYSETTKKFDRVRANLSSAKQRLLASGKTEYDPIPQHMAEAIEYGHDAFIFAYHGVHNPYHRLHDTIPVRPFGLFLKKDLETFSCVHGSPWDVTVKNEMAKNDVSKGQIDKYYLLPEDLRSLKPIQIQNIATLKNDFWYYFGNPTDWQTKKGYGAKLFETAGEMRYFEKILPEQIEGILWPMWYTGTDTDIIDENLDLQVAFKKEFPEISVINYTLDKFENFVLSLVEASYFTQRFYLEKGKFPVNAETAKIKVKP